MMRKPHHFKWYRFEPTIIPLCVKWYTVATSFLIAISGS